MNIIMLTSGGDVASLTFNALKNRGIKLKAVVRDIEFNRKRLVVRRIKKLGIFKVAGQLLFQILVVRFLNFYYKNYKSRLKKEYGIDTSWQEGIHMVEGINSQGSINTIQSLEPDVIVLAGTKILSKSFLCSFNCPVINVHVGITPKYRGVHGGYWALANGDPDNFGVTVHLVDRGIDTGKVLKYARVNIENKDSFVTYGLKQLKIGVEAMADVLEKFIKDEKIEPITPVTMETRLYSHPTILQYFFYLMTKNVK